MTSKQRQIIIKSLLWFITLFILIFVGVNNIFALTTKTIYSDLALSNSNQYNYGYTNAGGVDDVTTGTVGSRISGKTKYISFYLSENTSLNYTYTIRINFYADDLQPYFGLNYVKRIETCNSTACSNASIIAIRKQNNNGYSTWVELDFNPTQVGTKIGVVLNNDNGNYITGESYFGISSVQIESKNANQDVIDNATNNTNNIINNNNSNTENIINNNDENTQNIINNNDENTQKMIDELKKGQLTCGYNYKEEFNYTDLTNQGYIANNKKSESSNFRYSEPTIIFGGNIYDVSGYNVGSSAYYLISVYDANMDYLFDFSYKDSNTLDLSNYDGILYIIANVNYSDLNKLVIVKKDGICVPTSYLQMKQADDTNNKLDEQNKTSKGILGKLGDLFNNLFSTDDADLSGLDNMVGWLPPGPLDSIINLPLTLFNSLTNTLSGTCNAVSLTLPFVNKNLTLPCFNTFMSQYLTGFSTIWTLIGSIVSIFILYNYLLSLYKWVDDTLTLRENNLPGYYDDNWGGGA